MTRAFGLDLSAYNYAADGKQLMDFDAVANNVEPVEFVAMRAGISWGYTDKWFARSWSETKRIDKPRIAYHVPYFGEDAVRQMDHLFRLVSGAYWTHDRLCLDLEVAHDNNAWRINNTTNKMLNICLQRTGRYPILYSRTGWINQYLDVNALPTVDWWLALYRYRLPYPLYTPEYANPPILPKGVTTYLIHQTSERGKSIGGAGHYMDYNRWNGTRADVRKYFGYVGEEPTQPASVKYRCLALWGMKVRAYPDTSSEDTGERIAYNQIYQVYTTVNYPGITWGQIDPVDQKWVALNWSAKL